MGFRFLFATAMLFSAAHGFAPSNVPMRTVSPAVMMVQRAPKPPAGAAARVKKPSKFDKPRFDTGRDPNRPLKKADPGAEGREASIEGGVKMVAFYSTLPILFLGIQALGGNL